MTPLKSAGLLALMYAATRGSEATRSTNLLGVVLLAEDLRHEDGQLEEHLVQPKVDVADVRSGDERLVAEEGGQLLQRGGQIFEVVDLQLLAVVVVGDPGEGHDHIVDLLLHQADGHPLRFAAARHVELATEVAHDGQRLRQLDVTVDVSKPRLNFSAVHGAPLFSTVSSYCLSSKSTSSVEDEQQIKEAAQRHEDDGHAESQQLPRLPQLFTSQMLQELSAMYPKTSGAGMKANRLSSVPMMPLVADLSIGSTVRPPPPPPPPKGESKFETALLVAPKLIGSQPRKRPEPMVKKLASSATATKVNSFRASGLKR
ncbi:hypothetical protein TYRP_016262 [Tyrophagus putrescentiae]|nr:hypothetical protein TYRP_016262 [Tyrophagus putrescentiae]